MKCPKCDDHMLRYVEKRKEKTDKKDDKRPPRTNFRAKCRKCGWEGELR